MRSAALLLLLFAVAPSAVASHAVEPGVHALGVLDVHHEPAEPARGEPVQVTVRLTADTDAVRVTLLYCRAEEYACAPPVQMTVWGARRYTATIPWNEEFFRPALHVGYNISVTDRNGTVETSPLANWPAAPASLPPEAGIYYFYELGPERSSIPLSNGLAAIAIVALAAWRRR